MVLDTIENLDRLIFAETDQSIIHANDFMNMLIELAFSPPSSSSKKDFQQINGK